MNITVPYDTIKNRIANGYYRCYVNYKKNKKIQYLVQNNIDMGGVVAYYVDNDRCMDIVYGEQVLLEIAQMDIDRMDERAWTITYISEEQYNDLVIM